MTHILFADVGFHMGPKGEAGSFFGEFEIDESGVIVAITVDATKGLQPLDKDHWLFPLLSAELAATHAGVIVEALDDMVRNRQTNAYLDAEDNRRKAAPSA